MPEDFLSQLNSRSQDIFRKIVERYLETGTPVGVARMVKVFEGGLEGRAETLFTSAYDQERGIGTYVAMESFAGTIDGRISELIDAKAGLASRALDGEAALEEEAGSVQLQALTTLLQDALANEPEPSTI